MVYLTHLDKFKKQAKEKQIKEKRIKEKRITEKRKSLCANKRTDFFSLFRTFSLKNNFNICINKWQLPVVEQTELRLIEVALKVHLVEN